MWQDEHYLGDLADEPFFRIVTYPREPPRQKPPKVEKNLNKEITLFKRAYKSNDVDAMKTLLLNPDIPLDNRTKHGLMPVHEVCKNGTIEMAALFFSDYRVDLAALSTPPPPLRRICNRKYHDPNLCARQRSCLVYAFERFSCEMVDAVVLFGRCGFHEFRDYLRYAREAYQIYSRSGGDDDAGYKHRSAFRKYVIEAYDPFVYSHLATQFPDRRKQLMYTEDGKVNPKTRPFFHMFAAEIYMTVVLLNDGYYLPTRKDDAECLSWHFRKEDAIPILAKKKKFFKIVSRLPADIVMYISSLACGISQDYIKKEHIDRAYYKRVFIAQREPPGS